MDRTELITKETLDKEWYRIDDYFLHVMTPLIRTLAERTNCYPYYDKYGNEMNDMTFEEWKKILNTMADLFEEGLRVKYTERDKSRNLIDAGLELFTRYFHDLWD